MKRIAYTITPYTTVIRLLGVVQNPANGFPARPLDLFEGAEALGFDGAPYDYTQTVDNKGHGRVERRECWTITEADCLDYLDPQGQWPQLKAAVRVVGHRQTGAGGISQPRYYISSLAAPAEVVSRQVV